MMSSRWWLRSSCAYETFPYWDEDVPDDFAGTKEDLHREAVAICAKCPVREECLQSAIDNEEQYGVWGGLTAIERIDDPLVTDAETREALYNWCIENPGVEYVTNPILERFAYSVRSFVTSRGLKVKLETIDNKTTLTVWSENKENNNA